MNNANDAPVRWASPEEIIDDARNGRMFILVDDENRENEGDLIIPAQMATPDVINFMARHARGLICLALSQGRIDQLGLPPMSKTNQTFHRTAFTVSIEARDGVTTGISAADRARTIQVAIDPSRSAQEIVTPGHVFPLAARDGGILVRAGHTEAAVDVCKMAGLLPAGVICEIMSADGTMARLPELATFAKEHGLKIGSIADLISYRLANDRLVNCVETTTFDSVYGVGWTVRVYDNRVDKFENLALIKGTIDPDQPTLVRMHVMTVLDDLLGRKGPRSHQFQAAMRAIERAGRGVLVVVRAGSPGSYRDRLDLPLATRAPSPNNEAALREYGIGAQILVDLGVKEMILLTNSRRPLMIGLEGYGLKVVAEHPMPSYAHG